MGWVGWVGWVGLVGLVVLVWVVVWGLVSARDTTWFPPRTSRGVIIPLSLGGRILLCLGESRWTTVTTATRARRVAKGARGRPLVLVLVLVLVQAMTRLLIRQALRLLCRFPLLLPLPLPPPPQVLKWMSGSDARRSSEVEVEEVVEVGVVEMRVRMLAMGQREIVNVRVVG